MTFVQNNNNKKEKKGYRKPRLLNGNIK